MPSLGLHEVLQAAFHGVELTCQPSLRLVANSVVAVRNAVRIQSAAKGSALEFSSLALSEAP
jgi:hypothetical protein